MGGRRPEVAIGDVVDWVKGFVDLLVLGSGYQSSGRLAVWDAENIKKALRWGLFLENVLRHLKDSDGCEDYVKQIDEALLELKSSPYFPQGLQNLSTSTLSKASDFVLWHFLHTVRLRDEHLAALISAAVEMDLDALSKVESDCVGSYTERLDIQLKSLNLISGTGNPDFSTDSLMVSKSPLAASDAKTEGKFNQDLSTFLIRELLRRQVSVINLSSAETALHVLSDVIKKGTYLSSDSIRAAKERNNDSTLNQTKLKGCDLWNQWRSNALLYLLDKRTIRLVSGANLIFSAPTDQWIQIFERLRVQDESLKELLEILELLLLGLISSRWRWVIEHVKSFAGENLPITEQYSELHKFLQDRVHHLQFEGHAAKSTENDILVYIIKLLATQPQILWSLPPVLAATAFPSWSSLFSSYMVEIEKQRKAGSATFSCCTCNQKRKEHTDCELAERVWCLYIFHIQVSSCNG